MDTQSNDKQTNNIVHIFDFYENNFQNVIQNKIKNIDIITFSYIKKINDKLFIFGRDSRWL